MTSDDRFAKLVQIMASLRGSGGCPWDRQQTHESLRQHLLEETYEVIEAIDEGRYSALADELGDLLLQVIFHAQMASERDKFTIDDVIDNITDKLIRRHPHVFGDLQIDTAAEQIVQWETSKVEREGKKSALDGVPRELPALLRACRLQGKASAVGFDWANIAPVWDKVQEEIDELKRAVQRSDDDQVEEELGDLLFAVVNLSRFLAVNPEDALRRTIVKFERRFKRVEKQFRRKKRSMSQASLEEMDRIWEQVKQEEKQVPPSGISQDPKKEKGD